LGTNTYKVTSFKKQENLVELSSFKSQCENLDTNDNCREVLSQSFLFVRSTFNCFICPSVHVCCNHFGINLWWEQPEAGNQGRKILVEIGPKVVINYLLRIETSASFKFTKSYRTLINVRFFKIIFLEASFDVRDQ